MYTLSLFFLLIFFSTAASGIGAENEKLIEAAKREGKIVWYTSVGESQEIAKAFEKKYPFLKVEVLRLTNYPLLNRILNEARAGVYAYDVLRHGAFPMNLLIQKGLVQPYWSPERAAFEKGWMDDDGYWTSTDDNYFVIGYNTAMVAKADAPKDWEDLLKPAWRGKIGIDPDDHLLYGGLEEKWGEKRAGDFFRKLAQQKIQFRKGHTLLAQLIAAGEYPMGFVYAHRVELMKSQGAPIDWVSTMNPIISTIGPLALGAKPAHPNAGKLLIDFALSREGQSLLQSIYRIPSRTDMEPRSPSLNRQHLSLLPLSPSLADREQEWKRKFLAIFGLPN